MTIDVYTKIRFGKYKGQLVGDVIYDDPSYIRWAQEFVDEFNLDDKTAELLMKIENKNDKYDYNMMDYYDLF